MRWGIRRGATLLGLAGAMLVPASASADTAVMGSTLVNPYSGGVSTGATVTVQQSYQPGTSGNALASPANGVITSWSVKSGDAGALYTLRILRPSGLTNGYLGFGSSPAPTVVPNTVDPTGTILTYTASLPIKKGDSIGILQGGLSDVGLPQFQANGRTLDVFANNFSALPIDGGSATLTPDAQHELLLQATVSYCTVPKLKKKKLRKARKLLTASGCPAGKVKKKAKGPKKRGKVFKQSLAAGDTAALGTTVKLTVGK